MWYDKFAGVPPRGSLLETIFVLVYLHRQNASMLSTRAVVQSLVGLHENRATQDPAVQAFEDYCNKMFPFLDKAMDTEKEASIKRLVEFTKHPAKIALSPVYKQQAEHAKRMATLRRFKLRPKMPGIA